MRRRPLISPSKNWGAVQRAAGVLSSCGVSAKVSPQILLRLRPRIVWADEGRGWWGALSRSLFRGFAAKPRAALGIEGDLVVTAFYPRALGLGAFSELFFFPYAG